MNPRAAPGSAHNTLPRTEQPGTTHPQLGSYTGVALLSAFIDDQLQAVAAVQAAAPQLAAAVEAAWPRLKRGGRLLYVGAGTSGRLGLLDSVELYPTFGWPAERALAVLAGGERALWRAVEGAEDNHAQGAADLQALKPQADDVVLGLAASGTTPYVLGAIEAARAAGALTIGVANNPGAPVAGQAEIGVVLDTGPEVISGSTRLKAGTAQKIALNSFSSAVMVRLNKVYGNLMVDLKATNAKLKRRAVRLTCLATCCAPEQAEAMLLQCDFHVKTAIVAIAAGVNVAQAQQRLQRSEGDVQRALAGA
jgi:N-acetylmuramic acid 6-phosphate etherase